MQRHVGDGDFRDVVALSAHALAALPPAPVSEDRAQFENLLGLVQLFRNDPHAALRYFQLAADAWPDGAGAGAEHRLRRAAARRQCRRRRRGRAPCWTACSRSRKPVVATAHMTLAAALMGLHDLDGAEAELAKALEINPASSSATELLAELKQLRGDAAGAERLSRLALQNTTAVENFGELAALYFHLSWRDNEPVTRSRFRSPGVVTLH